MTLGLSADGVAAGAAVIGLAGTVVGIYLKLVVSGLEKDISGQRVASDKIEARLAAIEHAYLTRTEHAEFRAEIIAAVKDVGDRVTRSLDGFGQRLERLVERVAKVEGAAS